MPRARWAAEEKPPAIYQTSREGGIHELPGDLAAGATSGQENKATAWYLQPSPHTHTVPLGPNHSASVQ